jgi:arylsulfatase A-like enzyme
MNFQTISTAQKLPTSDGRPGGYLADGVTPGPVLGGALDYVDAQVGAFRAALAEQHLDRSTAIILSAKHGQSPDTPSALTRIPDGPIIDGLNAAWKAAHPASTKPLVAFSVNDDGMMIWLNERSQAGADFAKQYLLGHNGTGNDINGNANAYTASGLKQVFAGHEAADYFGVPVGDARRPDVFGIAQYGTVYTGKRGKIAEHGGLDRQDRNVPVLVVLPGLQDGHTVGAAVETTQIAPTILQLLGLDAQALKSVRIEHTQALPVGAEG